MSDWNQGAAPASVRDDRERDELDEYVHAFETDYLAQGGVNLADYLPPAGHPLYRAVLLELVRIDLEFGWERDCPRSLDAYQADFPELADDPDGLREIAYEDFRLRRNAGLAPSTVEYRDRYGLTLDPISGRQALLESDRSLSQVLSAYPSLAAASVKSPVGRWNSSRPTSFPKVGDDLLGFRLIDEIGRGAFGRVYLAQETPMADRSVVLKVSTDRHDESQTLAQLQHDNIVPIYSQCRIGDLRAVCMPYLGTVTLRDVVLDLRSRTRPPGSGRELLSSLSRSSQRRGSRTSGRRSGTRGVEAGLDRNLETSRGSNGAAVSPGGTGRGAVAADGGDRGGASASAAPPSSQSPLSQEPADHPPSSVGSWFRSHFTDRHARPADATSPATAPALSSPVAREIHRRLGSYTYVEAVLWLGSRVASGLAHAHDRGILHRDLKPANILISDDGQPVLLDFNLAADLKRVATSPEAANGLGGTLPYMAPEHLEAFLRNDPASEAAVDQRSDVFALGVILYELLTGRHPYPTRAALRGDRSAIRTMIADRKAGLPSLRLHNPRVSPAVEAIVHHCLEPDPSRRYSSAHDLEHDLELHLAHRPNHFAPNPSRKERLQQWARRNAVGITAVGVLGTIAMLFGLMRGSQDAAEKAKAQLLLPRIMAGAAMAQNRLSMVWSDPAQQRSAVLAARKALEEVHAREVNAAAWWNRSPVSHLATADQWRLRGTVGELLLLLAEAEARLCRAEKHPDNRACLIEALEDNRRAEACFDVASPAPRYLWTQRAKWLASLGDAAGAAACNAIAERTPRAGVRDAYFQCTELMAEKQYSEVVQILNAAIPQDYSYYWGHLSLGLAFWQTRELIHAEAAYKVCVGLAPDNPAAWFDLGLVEMSRDQYERAREDFARVVHARPDAGEALFNLAVCETRSGRARDAMSHFEQALAHQISPGRVHFARANAKRQLGDLEGAQKDEQEGIRQIPEEARDWVTRGIALMKQKHPRDGLADFEQALRLVPDHYEALRNKTVALDQLGETEEAIRTLDRVLTLYNFDGDARAGRAVLLARLGRRDEAVEDVDVLYGKNYSATQALMMASALAQASRIHPEDGQRAVALLKDLAQRGTVQLKDLETDKDLEPLRKRADYRQFLEDAQKKLATARDKRDVAPSPAESPTADRTTNDRSGHPVNVRQ